MPASETVLIVGAGPTGLALAATLVRHGVVPRIIERATVPPHDRSRAIVLQARTLEIFRDFGIDAQVLQRGLLVDAVTLLLPSGRRASIRVKPEWVSSRFNRFLALPQDETERALLELITASGVVVERGVSFEGFEAGSGAKVSLLRHPDGSVERLDVGWVVGTDGAHSGVRHAAGIPFPGETYRLGRVFVAGDAAHIHSPVGAQGMNTGIQDAYNLGWKLGLVVRGNAPETILESYHAERHPVGRLLLTRTDQAFGILAGGGRRGRLLRRLMPALGARLLTVPWLARRLAMFVSQTRIRYAHSPLAKDGPDAVSLPTSAPRAGDRLPDVPLETGEWLHDLVRGPRYTVVCVGRATLPAVETLAREIEEEYAGTVQILYVTASGPLVNFAGAAGAVYLVRPDKHIGFRTTATDATSMIPALANWLSPRRDA